MIDARSHLRRLQCPTGNADPIYTADIKAQEQIVRFVLPLLFCLVDILNKMKDFRHFFQIDICLDLRIIFLQEPTQSPSGLT